MSVLKRVIGVAALVLPMLAGAEEIGQVSTVFKFLGPNDRIVVEAFEITKVNGQPVIHADIDGAASNGTTMTIKALTNMYLLLHLMDRDLAGRIRLPYYLDEAADIDERNQAALLETSLQLGFVPILASVKPQVSARVAIDLEGGSGPNGIYIDEADWKFISRRDEVKAVVREDHQAEELA